MMATAFLPVNYLRLNFRLFARSRETLQLLRLYPTLATFIQYMEDTYVGERALFKPELWSVFRRRSDNRSNNWVEGN